VHFSDGRIIDLLGNQVRLPDGRQVAGAQTQPLEFAVGRRWSTRFETTFANGFKGMTEFECKVAAREAVTVPAGTFEAFRVEITGHSGSPKGPAVADLKTWFAPDRVRVPVIMQSLWRAGGQIVIASRLELVSYKQA
jgi:hypothetical protein